MQQASVSVDQLPEDATNEEGWPTAVAAASALARAPAHQKVMRLGTLEPPILALLRCWSRPAIVAIALFICVGLSFRPITLAETALALSAALLSRAIFSPPDAVAERLTPSLIHRSLLLLLEWGSIVALLGFIGYALKLSELFRRDTIIWWIALTPLLLLIGDLLCSEVATRASPTRRYIIVGANEVGAELARRASKTLGFETFGGFFDFRRVERLPDQARKLLSGPCDGIAAYVQEHRINAIYITLPMSSAPRIEKLLRELRDTTASIYFVPNIFAFDLIQARCVTMNGIPMLSICDTPFHGLAAVTKRASDLVVALLALLILWPVMLVATIAVKLSSPGPVLFKQRRYGLDGEQILVYKFRTMTVCEDGPVVMQATKSDQRVTRAGRWLRRTSLDELPQLLNVLRGEMSLVGPRPHAVAHNELYRKLINGYMIRHKVRPGMTGLAQVHGLRGETATVDAMCQRARYDLDYLCHWSLRLDLMILLKTGLIVLMGRNAY